MRKLQKALKKWIAKYAPIETIKRTIELKYYISAEYRY